MRHVTVLLCLLSGACSDVKKYGVTFPVDADAKQSVEEIREQALNACPSVEIDQDLMKRTRAALVDHRNRKKFVSWTNSYGNDDHNPGNLYVVYVYKGSRYTVWHAPPHEIRPGLSDEGLISIWERPNGSKGEKVLDGYSDLGMTGCVGFAFRGDEVKDSTAHFMRWNDAYAKDEGLVYHHEWQERYRRAIEGLAFTLGVKK